MKIILIFISILASLFANKASLDDVLGGKGKNITVKLKNGDHNINPSSASKLTQVSLWCDINNTNIKQFAIVNTNTLTKGSIQGDIILKDITYDGRNPSYAKITSKNLIFVFDSKDTDKNGSLVIGTDILRDGVKGGALNDEITVTDANIEDKASPIFISYETVDTTANGYIDKIKLTFSENIVMTGDTNKSFIVSGYTIPSSTSPSSSSIINITLTPKTTYDTHAKPNTTYTTKADSHISDSSGNPAINISTATIIEKDTAKPILVYVGGKSVHKDGDKIYLGFSEKIKNNLKEGRIKLDVVGGAARNALTKATFVYTPGTGEKNITITLDEDIDGVFIADDGTPKVTIDHNATDVNDNNFTAGKTVSSGKVEKEELSPKLTTITRVGDENKLKLTFDEPMNKTAIENINHYTVISTNASGNTTVTLASGSVKHIDKRYAIVTIPDDKFPKYSTNEAGKRKITITVKDGVTDLVSNKMHATERTKTYIVVIDKVAPLAHSFKLDMETGKLDIRFDEKIAVSGFNPLKIDINKSTILKKTLTSKSTATYSDKDVNISLNGDLDMLKDFLGTNDDPNLTINSGSGIIDFASVGFKGGNVSMASGGFNSDGITPKLISWDYDLDKKIFTLLFDEDMNVSSKYNATKIKLGDSNTTTTNDLVLLDKKSSAKTTTYRKVEIEILSSQINSILTAQSLKKYEMNSSKTFIKFATGSGITDSAGNEITTTVMPVATQSTWKSKYNTVSKLKVIANRWNHISVEHNTTSNDILSTGQVSYIYGHDGTSFVQFPTTLSSHKGYWIKTSSFSGTELNVSAIKNIKGSKEDDLNRIRNSEAKLNLIGIEHNLTYEEIRSKPDTKCKYKRIHHYVSDVASAKEGWDVNESVSANDALWVLCIK